ncbi:MAG: dihydropteridine reductase [Bacilli bacterium]
MNTNKTVAERIASDYIIKEESKLTALKKLDRKAKLPAEVFAYTFGIIMALVLGVGMCLAMKVIGSGDVAFIVGIIVGVVGIFGVSINYPIYSKILKSSKRKYANDIVELAKEITDEQ